MTMKGPNHDAFEALSVSTTATGFTAGTRGDRYFAVVTVEDAAVRFRLDGTAPTASVGHELEIGDELRLFNPKDVANAQFISRDGGTATLMSSFGSKGPA